LHNILEADLHKILSVYNIKNCNFLLAFALLLSCSSVAIQFSPWNSVDVLHFSSVQFILVLAVLYDYIMSIAINSFLVLAIPKQFSLVHAVSYSVNNTE
jgi:hypothetical protein